MTAEIRFFWARLNANYWFYPALFSILAAVLAFGMIYLDRAGLTALLSNIDWYHAARPKGAADMLTVMAGSMISIASTVFSITIAAVAYASGNYGPRLLTNFMEDRGNQLSLATFIASFVYALIVLRAVRTPEETASLVESGAFPGFVPQGALLGAYILLAISVAVLVFFLNHIPNSIRINKVLEQIGRRLLAEIEKIYPSCDEFRDPRETKEGRELLAWGTGYIQLIDFEDIAAAARERNCEFYLKVRTGDFVHPGIVLLEIVGETSDIDHDELARTLRPHFSLGSTRTPEQDPQFLIDELVEIGVRALSPGINDPFTAITALHWLGAATADLAQRDLRRNVCAEAGDEEAPANEEACPVIPVRSDFDHFVARGFGSMRGAVAASPTAAQIMFDVIMDAILTSGNQERKDILREEAGRLIDQARTVLSGPDLEMVETRYRQFSTRFLR